MTADLAESAMMEALTHLFAEDRHSNFLVNDKDQRDENAAVESETVEAQSVTIETIEARASQAPAAQAPAAQAQANQGEALQTTSLKAEEVNPDASDSTQEEPNSTQAQDQGPAAALPATIPDQENAKPKVSRAELIQIMEGFVELVKNSDGADFASSELSFAPPKIEVKDVVSVTDRTAEINELRTLLVEAQGTIIRLLTDRVDDRARLASLQNEIRLLPDLKAQSDRAMAVASTADEFKAEFAKVKLEIERMKLAKIRGDHDQKSRPWWIRFTDWLKKKDIVVQ